MDRVRLSVFPVRSSANVHLLGTVILSTRTPIHTHRLLSCKSGEFLALDAEKLQCEESQLRRDILASVKPALYQMDRTSHGSVVVETNLFCKCF